MILFFYILVLISLLLYSYVLIDPNLTLINHPWWVLFRDQLVYVGYYQRPQSWYIYLIILILLFIVHDVITKKYKQSNALQALQIGFITSAILILSYPFTSHDLFNYIFDAKIFTYYGDNPYVMAPWNYPQDEWLRFMHWIHRSYPYGPVYLVLSFIPSFLSLGKFILNFFFFKLFSIGFYLLGIYYLQKLDKKSALIFATHPLVLIEGLVAGHNDLIGVSLGIVGLYYLEKDKQVLSRLFFLLSAGIKFITAPMVLLIKDKPHINYVLFLGQLSLLLYLAIFKDIHGWYFLTLFAYIPLYKQFIPNLQIFFFGLLVAYYPFIRLGEWDADRVVLKKTIMITALVINLIYIVYKYRKDLPQVIKLQLLRTR
ncbi:MAG TPA: hypothetical protein PLS49_00245 [Candidatus Woesebacteria bacterium]|nr:hypothetical protein [Candidatus Woesebacteria bacterium]